MRILLVFLLRIKKLFKCRFVRLSGLMLAPIGDNAYGWLTKAKIICIVLLLFVNLNMSC